MSMIDIGFINLILIIANNVSDSKEPDSSHSSISVAPGSSHSFALIGSGSPHSSTSVKYFDASNSIPDFLADILANSFSNFIVYASFNLAVAPASSSAMTFLSVFPTSSRFSRDNFPALAADAFSALGQDISPDHCPSASCPLTLSLPPPGNFITLDIFLSLGCPLLLLLPSLDNFTALSAFV